MRSAAVLFVILAIGCTATMAQAEPPPLLPRQVLFGNPDRSGAQLSPDGKRIAFLAPDEKGVLQVWLQEVAHLDAKPTKVTADKKRGIRQFYWAFDGQHLLYLQDEGGDENFQVFGVDLQSKNVRNLTPFQGVRAQNVLLDPNHPGEMLVGLNLRNRATFDMHRVNLKTGAVELDTQNPGMVMAWATDAQFQVRAGLQARLDGGFDLLVRDDVKSPWRKLRSLSAEDQAQPQGFSADGKTLYVGSNQDANAIRLLAIDVGSGQEKVLAEDPEFDVADGLAHPTRHVPEAVAWIREKKEWKALDEAVRPDLEALAQLRRGEFDVVSRTLDDKTWLVSYDADNAPTAYYLWDRATRQGKLLFSAKKALEQATLAEMKPIQFKSRDGLLIRGYLTLPPGVEAKNLPAVLLVHGGPWARDTWGFNPMVQWLANRGYAVLQVNFRGSTGYGKQFLNAGNREWAGKMHDDLLDAVDWLAGQGTIDPKRVAIAGGSYGGYATLVGLTFTPDKFCCGVDIVGPSNIQTLLNSIPPYWAPMRAMFAKRVGDVAKEESFVKSRSPLFKVDAITKPLLIGQGANDPRVKQAESDQIYEAMKKNGKPVTYVIYSDEGHGFARPENRLHFYGLMEEFLGKHLGGRVEPATEIQGHSATVK